MLFSFFTITVSIFGTVCCLQFENNGVKITYKVTKYGTCTLSPVNKRIVSIPSLSVNECVHQCTIRRKCKGLNYRRKFKLCELVSENGVLETSPHCWFINRSDIVVEQTTCNDGYRDEQNSDGNGKCDMKVLECGYPEVANGKPVGNMFSVGDTQVVECDSGFSIHGSKTMKCLKNGSWDNVPECWKDCRDFHNADVQTFQNSSAHIRCHKDYVSNRTKQEANVTEETVSCTKNGTWIPNIDCIYFDNLFNVAWNKETSQSSNYRVDSVSAKATDGIWDPLFVNNSCSHTNVSVEDTAWWEVDLKQVYVIRKIKILNRVTDPAFSKLRNVTVAIGNSTYPTEECILYVGPAKRAEKVELNCVKSIAGQFVRLSKPNNPKSDNLALCEVGIYEQ